MRPRTRQGVDYDPLRSSGWAAWCEISQFHGICRERFAPRPVTALHMQKICSEERGQIRSIMGNVEVVYLPTCFPCPATVPVQKFSLKISSDQCPWLVPWILANSMNSLDFVTPRAWCPFLESPDNTWAFRDNKSFIVQEEWRVFSQDRSFDNFENDTIS